MAGDPSTRHRGVRAAFGQVVGIGGETVGIILQVLLVYIGAEFALALREDFNVVLVIIWCAVGTLYLAMTVTGLNVLVRLDIPDPPITRAMISHPLTRMLATVITFGASVLGLREAFVLIANVGAAVVDPLAEFSALWTMLLSWAMFNWGYARIYYSRYHRAAQPPLVFPGGTTPRLTDFVYFSFTNATTFSTSDVQVVSPRLRWTVVWHTSLAFFFNALIIALSMNVIAKGDLFHAVLS